MWDLRQAGNSDQFLQCGRWIDSRYAGVKTVTPKFKGILLAVSIKEIIEMQLRNKKRYSIKWKQIV